MKEHKKPAIIGIILAISFFIFNIYTITNGFTSSKSLLTEIKFAFILQIPLLAPAIVLLLNKDFSKKHGYVSWLYPIIIALGFLGIVLSKGPIIAGLLMIMVVYPICIILATAFYFLRNKPLTKKE